MRLKQYVVIRHGSNAANQSMTPKMVVGIARAETYDDAKAQASEEFNCYNNQFLELVPWYQATAAEKRTASEIDSMQA